MTYLFYSQKFVPFDHPHPFRLPTQNPVLKKSMLMFLNLYPSLYISVLQGNEIHF